GYRQQKSDADGRDQRQQFAAALAQRREDRRVHEPAKRRADHKRDADTDEIIAAEGEREEIGRECADGHDVRVREIDLHENAVDEGEPQCHEDIETAEDYAIDSLLEGNGQHDRSSQITRLPVLAMISTTCPGARQNERETSRGLATILLPD